MRHSAKKTDNTSRQCYCREGTFQLHNMSLPVTHVKTISIHNKSDGKLY